ncbi:MAG: radical SAM family heme chaperone HemW [Bryobacterales bacterium]|nr:radical SAM family heme chaperone HemW [Bryobacterales bacterium]
MPGVYISWPFCAQKCTYCNFASGIEKPEMQAQYLDALCRHLSQQVWPWIPETVYIGGGTPSLMQPDELARILAEVPGYPWPEFTLEAAPGSLHAETVTAWARLGVNRVSLGVQSFVEKELRQTGRRHDAQGVASDCELLRAKGIGNFNIDLIAGLPHQSADSWEESLRWVERLAPPHVSVYMLEVDEDSRLGLEILGEGSRYGAGAVAPDEGIVANYERAVQVLADLGIPRYEISNFARPGFASTHNLKYWRMEPYFGFGVDAHSCDGTSRWGSPEATGDYIASVNSGSLPGVGREAVRPLEEKFLTGLRLDEGLAIDLNTLPEPLRNRIDTLIGQAMLCWNENRLRFTSRGVLVSNDIFEEFLGADEFLSKTNSIDVVEIQRDNP